MGRNWLRNWHIIDQLFEAHWGLVHVETIRGVGRIRKLVCGCRYRELPQWGRAYNRYMLAGIKSFDPQVIRELEVVYQLDYRKGTTRQTIPDFVCTQWRRVGLAVIGALSITRWKAKACEHNGHSGSVKVGDNDAENQAQNDDTFLRFSATSTFPPRDVSEEIQRHK